MSLIFDDLGSQRCLKRTNSVPPLKGYRTVEAFLKFAQALLEFAFSFVDFVKAFVDIAFPSISNALALPRKMKAFVMNGSLFVDFVGALVDVVVPFISNALVF